MANFYVTHHRYPQNPQLFTVNISKIVKRGGEINPNFSPSFSSGESYWELFIYTTGTDSNGNNLDPVFLDYLGSENSINDIIDNKVQELCALIDWSQQGKYTSEIDNFAPQIVEQTPSSGATDVPIGNTVSIRVREGLPGSGIDVSTISFKINGISINPNISGNPYDYIFYYKPQSIYNS